MWIVFAYLMFVVAGGASQAGLESGLYNDKPSWCETRDSFGATQADKEKCDW